MSRGRRVSRRAILQLLAGGTGLALLAACGQQAPAPAPTSAPAGQSAPAATTAPVSKPAEAAKPADAAKPAAPAATAAPAAAQKPAGQPKSGGTLRVGQVGDIATLDATFTPGSADTIWGIHDRLTAYDDKFQPQPMLAESWELSSDSKQIKFNLRKGVQYHSGRELTSADVDYNIKRVQGGKSFNGQIEKQSKWWTTIEMPDKYTIVLKSEAARPTLFDFFEYLNIQDKDTLEGPDAKSKGVGTGPYMLKEWVQGDHITLTKNKNYWQSGNPYLDGIEVKILSDTQSMVAQMEAGALDFIITPPLTDLNRLKSDAKYQTLLNNNSGAVTVIGMSVPKPPFDKKEVRQALNYALDRKRYAESILLGTGSPTVLPWTSTSPGYDASKNTGYGFDLEKAKALLGQAGVTSLEMDALVQANNAEVLAFSQVYQADLSKLGIKMNIQKLEQAAWLDQVNKVTYRGIWLGGIAFAQLEPATTFQNSRGLDPTANSSGFVQDKYTQLVTAANAEPDKAKRKDLYNQLNDLFIDESFLMVLSTTPARALATSKVQNVRNQAHGGFSFTEAWLD
jgi:peptide/nickel transport system substrate-binding protein